MSETYNLQLPLIQPGQAQKHVTVNEALARLDATAQLRLVALGVLAPPAAPVDGAAWAIGAAPTGDWYGHGGEVAIFANGGWVFVAPKVGWRCWVEALGNEAVFDGQSWVSNAAVVMETGASSLGRIAQLDHVITAGTTTTTVNAIPQNAVVLGVTGRVVQAITGSGITGWQLGVAGSANRYGSGLGLAVNSYALGLTGQPQCYYADTQLILTAEGGSFAGGMVRLAVHYATIIPPRPV